MAQGLPWKSDICWADQGTCNSYGIRPEVIISLQNPANGL